MKSRLFDGDRSITSPFGPRTGGFHDGVDFSMPIGTNLYAPDDATISNLKDQFGANYQSLRFGNGQQMLLVHLNDFVASGQVKRGQLIAHSGNSGQSTGPHTHVTLRTQAGVSSSAINPVPYLEGGEPMINDADNEFARWNKLFIQVRGRQASRQEFKNAAVGRTWLAAMETLSDDAEADRNEQAANVGRVAITDNWEKQINDLTSTVTTLQTTTTNLTTEVNNLEKDNEASAKSILLLEKQIADLKAQLGSPKPTGPQSGQDSPILKFIQAIVAWFKKYISD